MKNYVVTLVIASALTSSVVVVRQKTHAQDISPQPGQTRTPIVDPVVAETNTQKKPPIFATEIPPGYRDWKLISVAREEGELDDIRAILGNDIAIQAYRDGTLPFPDGAIIARLAWSFNPSEENNKAFGRPQSFVAGLPKNGVQFMVKDAKKYAATGGWGFAHFNDGKPATEAVHKTCFACHEPAKARDFVFTRYAP